MPIHKHEPVIGPFQPNPVLLSDDARARERGEWAVHTIAAIDAAARDGRLTEAMLTDGIMRELARTDVVAPAVPSLLDTRDPVIISRFVPFLEDPDYRLVAYVHPLLRSAAWLGLDLSDDTEGVRFALAHWLPLTDTAAESIPGAVLARWQTSTEEFLADPGRAELYATETLPFVAKHLERLRRQGYPERFIRFVHALESLAATLPVPLSPSSQEGLDRLAAGTVVPLSEPELPASSSSSSAPAVIPAAVPQEQPVDPAALRMAEARARSLLTAKGAVYSMQTAIKAVTADQVNVTGIVWSSPTEEHLYGFTFDIGTQTVSAIRRDGELLPNSLPLDAFAAWAQQ